MSAPAQDSLPPEMPERDAEGYLIDPADWSEPIARYLAAEEGIDLGEDHWEALRFMREHWEERQIAADARLVIRRLEARLGPAARRRLFELFPYGYVQQACKIAGMKRPRAWSTG